MGVKTKEELEREKLKLEIKSLGMPWHKKPSTWLGIISVIVATVGVFGQSYISKLERAEAKEDVREAQQMRETIDIEIAQMQVRKDSLEAFIAGQYQRISALQNSTNTLNRIAQSQDLPQEERELLVSIAKETNNAGFTIGLYGFQVDASDYRLAREGILDQGYTLIGDALMTERTSWLALSSVVFYYDDTMQSKAAEISKLLTTLTGETFTEKIGSGLGVPESQKANTFRIHWIR